MARLWRSYLGVLEHYPWTTQSTTTGVLMGAGDVIAQIAVEKKDSSNYDYKRSIRFFLFGQIIAGPLLRGWYLTLDKLYKGNSKRATLLKVLTDQTVFAPSFLTFFIGTMAVMRKEPVEEVKRKIKRDFMPVLITNYKIWPAVQLVNFYFVPFQHRILVVNVVALGWNIY
ncbi:protein Mpv17-like isoform X2 [Liolophura sinensis]|uniref:protein Mpv17-like isoform X2 n=1 Tax=Liolophura sinensis TaxID=3198878 RepID=UPI003159584A